MDICVVGGAGYVGLITGLGLAGLGHTVINVDVNQDRVNELQKGHSPIYEKGIESLLRESLDSSRIKFTTNLSSSVDFADIILITVGTPSFPNGNPDHSQIINVAEDLARSINRYKLIVIKSTLSSDTVALVRNILRREKIEGEDFDIAVNPEFLQEGNGFVNFFNPDRIVFGASAEKPFKLLRRLYKSLLDNDVPLVETDIASAQMIKYASNAFLATRISFMNEIASLCSATGADVLEVGRGMGYDQRIGHRYLQPSPGFGGPCLEKDLNALIYMAETNSHDLQLLKAVRQRNEKQVPEILSNLKKIIGPSLYQKTIAIFGLSFKAETKDVRNSVSLKMMDCLTQEGASVRAYDPIAIDEAKILRPDLVYIDDPYQAAENVDAIMLMNEWPSFAEIDYSRIKNVMSFPLIIDGRNVLDPIEIRELGFTYLGIGR